MLTFYNSVMQSLTKLYMDIKQIMITKGNLELEINKSKHNLLPTNIVRSSINCMA